MPKEHPEYDTGNYRSGKCANGLKPAPHYWNHCHSSTYGPVFVHYEANNSIVSVLKLHVDDMIVYARKEFFLDIFKKQLSTSFKVRSTDVFSDFVGLELHKKPTYLLCFYCF